MAVGLGNWCLSKARTGDTAAQDLNSYCLNPCDTDDNCQGLILMLAQLERL